MQPHDEIHSTVFSPEIGVCQNPTETQLTNEATCGLGELRIKHPPGVFPVTPASLASLHAIGSHPHLLSGVGIDWGTGAGTLCIAAARILAVTRVVGLDIVRANVEAARENAVLNGVAGKTEFFYGDSFELLEQQDRLVLEALRGSTQFVLANPPSSEGDDGFEFRRRVLRESRDYLAEGGVVFLNISTQYGRKRIANLTRDIADFSHRGVLATTDLVPFDLNRPDLLDSLQTYVDEEQRGGLAYEFTLPERADEPLVTAEAAVIHYRQTGESPLSKWQTHLFEYRRGR